MTAPLFRLYRETRWRGVLEIPGASTGKLVGVLRILFIASEGHLLRVLLSRAYADRSVRATQSVHGTRDGSLRSQRAAQGLQRFDHLGGPLRYFVFAQRALAGLEDCS